MSSLQIRGVRRVRVHNGDQMEKELEYDAQTGSCGRIERVVENNGPPYIRVYDFNDNLVAEFCQHNVVGVFYR